MLRTKCDECGGKIVLKNKTIKIKGIDVNNFPVEICDICHEEVYDGKIFSKEENKIVKKNKIKIKKIGEKLILIMPGKLSKMLKGREVFAHKEGNKLIIEDY